MFPLPQKLIIGEWWKSKINSFPLIICRQVVGVEEVFVHEGFDYDTFDNDISLIKLAREVDLDLFTPVCLPRGDMNKDNANVWITGEVVFF